MTAPQHLYTFKDILQIVPFKARKLRYLLAELGIHSAKRGEKLVITELIEGVYSSVNSDKRQAP